jgi:hypothetical protein
MLCSHELAVRCGATIYRSQLRSSECMKRRAKRSGTVCRSRVGGGLPALVAALLIVLACGAPNPGFAESNPIAYLVQDTTLSVRADTSAAPKKESAWTMDELKTVLGRETVGFKSGAEYKERKSGRVAMMCALLCPGLGQIYNEKPLKAALAAGAEWYYLSKILLNRRYCAREKKIRDSYPVTPSPSSQWLYHDSWVKEYWERSVDWTWWAGAAVVVIMIDAYVDAHLDDMHFRVEAGGEKGGVELSVVFRY